ncbi:MAG: flagellin [Desulfobulbaceae bacterium]|nr:flagellin [Desulfobulbaceae bacterium]
MKINNVGFSQASLYLKDSQKALTESLSRFSAGKRITKAADDASGMAIANALESQVRGYGQAIRNATDAIAIGQIADGALGESSNLIMDIRTKALQAANGSQSLESRQALQADIDKNLVTLNEIAQNTSYNGQKLLSGQFSDKSFQVGASAGETIGLSIDSAETASLGGETGTLSDINVLSAEGAQDAVAIADAALSELNLIRSDIGSTQNQLSSTIENLSLTRVNVASAQSQIEDLDFAEESINFNKMQILNKARIFAVTQGSKISKQGMNELLQG